MHRQPLGQLIRRHAVVREDTARDLNLQLPERVARADDLTEKLPTLGDRRGLEFLGVEPPVRHFIGDTHRRLNCPFLRRLPTLSTVHNTTLPCQFDRTPDLLRRSSPLDFVGLHHLRVDRAQQLRPILRQRLPRRRDSHVHVQLLRRMQPVELGQLVCHRADLT